MMRSSSVADVRKALADLLYTEKFTQVSREASMTDLTGKRTIEIVGASFIADEQTIFGEMNWDYVNREQRWYESQSLNVNDFPGGAPATWKAVAADDGSINSNYGWVVFSGENGRQFESVLRELSNNPESRRAECIYNRPNMWRDYNRKGMSDFMCTNAVQYLVRDGAVDATVQMRSNDGIFGYKNDRAWQQHVLEHLARELALPSGKLHWQVGSMHVYERHFYLVDHYLKTGGITVCKSEYDRLYPNSEWGTKK